MTQNIRMCLFVHVILVTALPTILCLIVNYCRGDSFCVVSPTVLLLLFVTLRSEKDIVAKIRGGCCLESKLSHRCMETDRIYTIDSSKKLEQYWQSCGTGAL